MRVLITGAAGFLGRHLLPKLANARHEVVALVRPGGVISAAAARVVEIDLAAPDLAERLPREIDAIIHLAQSRHYRDFPNAAIDMLKVNVVAAATLMDHAVRFGVSRVVIASTGSVYGPSEAPVAEDAAASPPDYYASSKFSAELLASSYVGCLTLCIFRIFRLYGPGQASGFMPNLIARIREDRAVTLAGAEGMRLTPTHVEDAANIFAAAAGEGWSGTFNLAAPHVITLRSLCSKIGALVRKVPSFEIVDGAGDVVPDVARLASRYDVGSMRSVDQGLRDILIG